MIQLTRLNSEEFVLNAELIRELESRPDTIITMTDDRKIVVRESVQQVVDAVIGYKQSIHDGPGKND